MSAGVVGATPASTAVRCAPSDEERRLLERHRPRLRYDRQLDYRAMSAASMLDNPGNVLRRWDGEVLAGGSAPGIPRLGTEVLDCYPHGLEPEDGDHIAAAPDFAGDARRMQRDPAYADRVYGRVVRDGGRTWLQYWIWFYYNPKHLLGFGAHEGDWELVQIGLGPRDEPEVAIYAQHARAQARPWSRVERHPAPDGPHPVVYVAALSHASYFTPGSHPYPTGIDHTYWPEGGRLEGPAATPELEDFGAWVAWPGHWGNLAPVLGGWLGNGPRGPAHQGKWAAPARFHRQARRRRVAELLGRALRWMGRLTYPCRPRLRAGLAEGDRVVVDYELPTTWLRRARHLYLTVHTPDEQHALAGRVVRLAPRQEPRVEMVVPGLPEGVLVLGSAFNRLRQRSNIAEATARRPQTAAAPRVTEARRYS